jgi:predicted acylesterase/phospholipase RssA
MTLLFSSSSPPCLVTVAFSGAGHLLAYHLGVACQLRRHVQLLSEEEPQQQLQPTQLPPTQQQPRQQRPWQLVAVSGSSSGAIAAAVLSHLPRHLWEEYAHRFIQDRGYALRTFQEMRQEQELRDSANDKPSKIKNCGLHVCVTNSNDGTPHLLSFPNNSHHDNNHSQHADSLLLRALEASCRIPVSFHPWDLFQKSSSPVTYRGEGMDIDGTFYVDGGLSGLFPPRIPIATATPLSSSSSSSSPGKVVVRQRRILVTPFEIIGPLPCSSSSSSQPKDLLRQQEQEPEVHVICPNSNTTGNGILPSSLSRFFQTRDGVTLRPGLFNVQAMAVASGVFGSSTSSNVLASWYQRGQDDAESFLEKIMNDD